MFKQSFTYKFIIHAEYEVDDFHFLFAGAPLSPVGVTESLGVQLL